MWRIFSFQCGLVVLPPMVIGGGGKNTSHRQSCRSLESLARLKSSLERDCHVLFCRPLPTTLDTTNWRPLWPAAAFKTAQGCHKRRLLRREELESNEAANGQRPRAPKQQQEVCLTKTTAASGVGLRGCSSLCRSLRPLPTLWQTDRYVLNFGGS